MRCGDPVPVSEFATLAAEKRACETLAPGVFFRTSPYTYVDAHGTNLVNIYAVEAVHGAVSAGMQFSATGNHCVSLAREAQRQTDERVVCAINGSFSLLADDIDSRPKDVSFNLHVERGRLFQLPVADKTALLIDRGGRVELRWCLAHGQLRLGELHLPWCGSLSKAGCRQREEETTVVVYNSFNRQLRVVPDPLTGTRRVLDQESAYTPRDQGRSDVLVGPDRYGLVVTEVNPEAGSHVYAAHMILSVPRSVAERIRIGDHVTAVSLGKLRLERYCYAATVGAMFTPDARATERRIAHSEIVRTRAADTGRPVYGGDAKHCRSCVVITPDRTAVVLADARRGVSGQGGLTISELRRLIQVLYPEYTVAANLDGGHAAKLVVRRDGDWEAFGNMHFKDWPIRPGELPRWNGYLGAKIGAVMYLTSRGGGGGLELSGGGSTTRRTW